MNKYVLGIVCCLVAGSAFAAPQKAGDLPLQKALEAAAAQAQASTEEAAKPQSSKTASQPEAVAPEAKPAINECKPKSMNDPERDRLVMNMLSRKYPLASAIENAGLIGWDLDCGEGASSSRRKAKDEQYWHYYVVWDGEKTIFHVVHSVYDSKSGKRKDLKIEGDAKEYNNVASVTEVKNNISAIYSNLDVVSPLFGRMDLLAQEICLGDLRSVELKIKKESSESRGGKVWVYSVLSDRYDVMVFRVREDGKMTVRFYNSDEERDMEDMLID